MNRSLLDRKGHSGERDEHKQRRRRDRLEGQPGRAGGWGGWAWVGGREEQNRLDTEGGISPWGLARLH